MSIPQRLLDKVFIERENECWIWQASFGSQGYGQVWYDGKLRGAHRAFYAAATGRNPNNLEVIRHTCDNKACVNPAHLIEGSHADNNKDRLDRLGGCCLTKEKVALIKRDLIRKKGTHTELGLKYGCSRSMIGEISRGASWKDIDPLEKKDG